MQYSGKQTEETVTLLADVEEDPPKSTFAPIIAQVACGFFALALLTGMVFILVFFGTGSQRGKLFGFDELASGFSAKSQSPVWLSDNSGKNGCVWQRSFGGSDCLVFYNLGGNVMEQTVLFCTNYSISGLNINLTISSYSLSPDGTHLLLPINITQIWRHSFLANYLIIELGTLKYYWLGGFHDPNNPRVKNAVWNPSTSGEYQNTIVYVVDNNICISSPASPCQFITNDGNETILNGVSSWLYEEEVLSSAITMWWSKSGRYLAYFKTNDGPVETFQYPMYYGNSYTNFTKIRYPKAGTPNPIVTVCVFDLTTNITAFLDYEGEYVTDLTWYQDSFVALRTEDRKQHTENFLVFNSSSFSASTTASISFVTQQVDDGWIQPRPGIVQFMDEDTFILISNNSGYYHIAKYSISKKGLVSFLTNGSFDVLDIVGYNPSKKIVFYLSTEDGVTVSNLYGVSVDSTIKFRLTTDSDAYYTASFNSIGSHFVLSYNGPNLPNTKLMDSTLQTGNVAQEITTIEDNRELQQKLAGYDLPKKTYMQLTVPGTNGSVTLNAWLMIPPRLRTTGFPLLLNVYTGPGSQTVTKKWALGFNEYIASSLEIAVASVDPRGTGGRGIQFMQQTYKNLGHLESIDLANALPLFAPYSDHLDLTRAGIWGWSYGGYMALMTLVGMKPSPFKVGVSVAPVTDWHFYDTFYTERFMGDPTENAAGYNRTSILQNAMSNHSSLSDGKLLLIHGTGDDNVHFQNSMELNRVLISLGIQYDTMVYANRDHSISTGGARNHLYKKISNFLSQHL